MPGYCATHLGDGDHALVRATGYQNHPTLGNTPVFYDGMCVIGLRYKYWFGCEVRVSVFVYYPYIL